MPSTMEDYRLVLEAPRPRKPLPFRPYDVSFLSERVVRMLPIHEGNGVSSQLVEYLTNEMNEEIERGDTYPMVSMFSPETFRTYFFGNFTCIMVDVTSNTGEFWKEDHGPDFWRKVILGAFYIKPNYPGRCFHVCNAGFLVPGAVRGQGSGRYLAQAFLHFAPELGYKSSIFNLVFATNVASIRLWDKLGFEKVGIVRGAGRLKGHKDLVDAYIYGYQFPEESAETDGGKGCIISQIQGADPSSAPT